MTVDGPATTPGRRGPGAAPHRRGLYARVLRLRRLSLTAWQRALLGEGTLVLAGLLVLADLVSAWALLVLPLLVAALVKAHDLLAGALGAGGPGTRTAPVREDRRRRSGEQD